MGVVVPAGRQPRGLGGAVLDGPLVAAHQAAHVSHGLAVDLALQVDPSHGAVDNGAVVPAGQSAQVQVHLAPGHGHRLARVHEVDDILQRALGQAEQSGILPAPRLLQPELHALDGVAAALVNAAEGLAHPANGALLPHLRVFPAVLQRPAVPRVVCVIQIQLLGEGKAQLLRRMVIYLKNAQRPQVPGGAHGDPRVLRGGGDGPGPLLLRVQPLQGEHGLGEVGTVGGRRLPALL